MSRGPGRWQAAILCSLYAIDGPPQPRQLHVRSWLRDQLFEEPTDAQFSAVHRAARRLVENGQAKSATKTFVGVLEPVNVSWVWRHRDNILTTDADKSG